MKVTMRAMRVNAGLTQAEAAQKLGVTKRTICSWEQHKTFPTIVQLRQMCDAYHCDAGDIFLPDKLAKSE